MEDEEVTMKKKSNTRYVIARVVIALVLVSVGGYLILGGRLFASFSAGHVSNRTLSFADRVTYQRAIEEVFWRHRIWPKENSGPKPSLDAVISRTQLEAKVRDYLRESQDLENSWQRPLTAEQLQAEMERMAQHTRRPEVLRELFEALGNDPFVIAQCLARPALSQRLITDFSSDDQGLSDSARGKAGEQMATMTAAATFPYALPTISGEVKGCMDDTWTPTAWVPPSRLYHTAVWTGSEMIVWGGSDGSNDLYTGGRYNPSTDTWNPTSTVSSPAGRQHHAAIWTGH